MLAIRRLVCALLLCLTAAAVAVTPAFASRGQLTFFEAPNELLSAATRDRAFAQLQTLGVRALRVQLYWHSVAPAPNSGRRPNFDATDPASYSWGQYDAVLAQAQRLHWQVLLTVTSPVPKWATAGHRDRFLVTRPDNLQFQQFMTAVGRHYGSQVALYAIWNEPDHAQFLRPQFNANGTPASPRIYRGLFQAGYAGLQAAGIAHPKVLMGETAPAGVSKINPRRESLLSPVAPLAFLREALCLNSRYVKAGTCSALPVYGYAHHAYGNATGPFDRAKGADSVTIGVLSRLTGALDRAARAHAIPGHLPVYLTEFGVQSKPNRFLGVSVAQQAEYDAIAERIAYFNPRVASFSQYLLRDDPLGGAPGSGVRGGTVGFQTGLRYVNGRAKPLYFGFPVPLTVLRRGHRYSLWGLVRPATGTTTVTVMVAAPHSSRFHKLRQVRTDSAGAWTLSSATRAGSWRVQWRSPTGTLYTGPPIRAY
jgi:hypothetical protein